MPEEEEIKLADISDVVLLKALAYDRLCAIELNQNELTAINTRLQEIAAEPPDQLSSLPIELLEESSERED